MSRAGVIGVSDHGGWAVMVTSDAIGTLLDLLAAMAMEASTKPEFPFRRKKSRTSLSPSIVTCSVLAPMNTRSNSAGSTATLRP